MRVKLRRKGWVRAKLIWTGISVLSWVLLGIILTLIGGSVVAHTWTIELIRFGAVMGLVMGLFYSGAALLTAFSLRSRRVMPWMIGSSLVGAIVCFWVATGLGGYPKGSQMDLSFLLIASVSVAFGGLLGSGLGMAMWRSRVGF